MQGASIAVSHLIGRARPLGVAVRAAAHGAVGVEVVDIRVCAAVGADHLLPARGMHKGQVLATEAPIGAATADGRYKRAGRDGNI